MNGVDLGYTSHCCQSSERDRMGGAGIVEWLRTQTFPIGSVGQFLQASLSLPFSKETYLALRKLRLADFQKTYLRLIIGKRKRIGTASLVFVVVAMSFMLSLRIIIGFREAITSEPESNFSSIKAGKKVRVAEPNQSTNR